MPRLSGQMEKDTEPFTSIALTNGQLPVWEIQEVILDQSVPSFPRAMPEAWAITASSAEPGPGQETSSSSTDTWKQ